MDESPNVMDVDDVTGNDEIVVVELVNLLSIHGCLTAPSCLILYDVNRRVLAYYD